MIQFTKTEYAPTHYWLQDIVGLIPDCLNEWDRRDAKTQLHDGYLHGGGWTPVEGFAADHISGALRYPGDPTMLPWAAATLRNERIFVYESAWVCIIQPDGSFEVARMD